MDVAVALLLTLFLGLIVRLVLFHPRNPNAPPCLRGWVPWFGAAFQFGAAPLEFIEQARIQYGQIFTVFALGNRYTFVTEEEGIQVFCTSKDADFEQAVQRNTASTPKQAELYSMMKGKLSTSNLHLLSGTLCKELHEHMEYLGPEGNEELCDLVRHVMYPAVVNTLFGKGICPTSKNEIKEFEKHFQKYDEDFEYGSQMPECFMRKWSKSKKWLLKVFEKVVSDAERSRPSDSSSRVNLSDFELTSTFYSLILLRLSVLVLLQVAFWTLAFVISQPSIYKIIMEDLVSVYGKAGKEKIDVSEDDLKKLPFIKWCILETIRLRAPGTITKKVINPIKIQNFIIPVGDMLMMSPYWLHRNPKYFPEPEMFKPDRWKEANLEKNAFLDGFMAFGVGTHQCPGRSVKQLGVISSRRWQGTATSESLPCFVVKPSFIVFFMSHAGSLIAFGSIPTWYEKWPPT
uniref:Lanosterol 14-alpha demethylase n=1 Tax=Sphenodon punctatus TaxID=8508 RepID=A0A8D0LCN8_SPHPU